MQSTNATYNSLFSANARKQVQIIINGIYTYDEDAIISVGTSLALFSGNTMSLGGTVAKRLNVRFYPGGDYLSYPQMASVVLKVRLTNGTTNSSWLTKGTFYIDTRKYDSITGIMELECYDAMLKGEELYILDANTPGTWPQNMRAVASDIATRLGVTFENSTAISNTYTIDAPPFDMSMREILGYIAVANGGNFIITEGTNKLRFVAYAATPSSGNTQDLGYKCSSFVTSTRFDTISKVIMNTSADTYLESGDNTGREIEVYCPWGTQTICNALKNTLAAVSFEYLPYEAQNAYLNPAMELGDYITVNGTTGMICTVDVSYDALSLANVTAPTDEEINHEFPTRNTMEDVVRRVQSAQASIAILGDEIELKVDADGVIAAINLSQETATISASKVNLAGYVTVTDLSGSGTTTINGANIMTSSITADKLNVSSLYVKKVYFGEGTQESPYVEILSGYTYTPAIGHSGVNTILGDTSEYSMITLQGPYIEIWDGSNSASILKINIGQRVIVPTTTGVWDIGEQNSRFRRIWAGSVHASTLIATSGNITADGNVTIGGNISVSGDITANINASKIQAMNYEGYETKYREAGTSNDTGRLYFEGKRLKCQIYDSNAGTYSTQIIAWKSEL